MCAVAFREKSLDNANMNITAIAKSFNKEKLCANYNFHVMIGEII